MTERLERVATTSETANSGVIVVSGPAGVGKSTISRMLCERLPAELSVSITTRPPRPGEVSARDYHYVSREEFEHTRQAGGLLEWAEVYGHFYGTPLAAVQKATADGRRIVLEIDIRGCQQVRGKMPAAMTFFILPPSADEQRRRIEGRQTDAAEVIAARLAKADGEIRYAQECGCFDVFLINDDLDETVRQIIEHVKRRG